jgi:hypothetical protein
LACMPTPSERGVTAPSERTRGPIWRWHDSFAIGHASQTVALHTGGSSSNVEVHRWITRATSRDRTRVHVAHHSIPARNRRQCSLRYTRIHPGSPTISCRCVPEPSSLMRRVIRGSSRVHGRDDSSHGRWIRGCILEHILDHPGVHPHCSTVIARLIGRSPRMHPREHPIVSRRCRGYSWKYTRVHTRSILTGSS